MGGEQVRGRREQLQPPVGSFGSLRPGLKHRGPWEETQGSSAWDLKVGLTSNLKMTRERSFWRGKLKIHKYEKVLSLTKN
jgi:hypothetical protein